MQEDIINALGTASFAACYCKKFFCSYWKQTLLFLGFALTPSLLREKSDKQIKVVKEREWLAQTVSESYFTGYMVKK